MSQKQSLIRITISQWNILEQKEIKNYFGGNVVVL